jgi:phosphoglycerate dehydrogenase-like enzyme
MIGAAELAKMKPTAILVNSAARRRGRRRALVEALRAKRIAGAGLDVFEGEPSVNPGFLGSPTWCSLPTSAAPRGRPAAGCA